MSTFSLKKAMEAWAPVAFDELKGVAGTYHATVTYQELADKVMATSGIDTKMHIRNWIGPLLDVVADLCKEQGVPLVTALVVSKTTEEVSEGYGKAVYDVYGFTPEDFELHAAEEREKCYVAFGAEIPPNAAPAFTPMVKAKRQRQAPPKRRPVCPTCYVQLPLTGGCGSCE